MKILLTALLIVLVFGCKDKGKPYETRRTFIFGIDTLDMENCGQFNFDKWRAGHFNGNGHNDTTDRVFYDTFRIQCPDTVFVHDTVYTSKHYGNVENLIIRPKPSPIPDTTKPLKIKMQPRWRDSVISYGTTGFANPIDSIVFGGPITENTTIDKFASIWNELHESQDTSRCLLLVSDTSSQNGFRSSRCWWMEGYRVSPISDGNKIDLLYIDDLGMCINAESRYLDQSKIPLKKNIIVWLSKEIK